MPKHVPVKPNPEANTDLASIAQLNASFEWIGSFGLDKDSMRVTAAVHSAVKDKFAGKAESLTELIGLLVSDLTEAKKKLAPEDAASIAAAVVAGGANLTPHAIMEIMKAAFASRSPQREKKAGDCARAVNASLSPNREKLFGDELTKGDILKAQIDRHFGKVVAD